VNYTLNNFKTLEKSEVNKRLEILETYDKFKGITLLLNLLTNDN